MIAPRKLLATAAAMLALLAFAGGARADVVPSAPRLPAQSMVLTGTLEYVKDLESPHYELNGWAIAAPDFAVLSLLAGKTVIASGRPSDSVSILMRKQLVVSSMTTTLEGDLVAVDDRLELEGWIIKGLESEIFSLAGSRVRVVGSVVWRSKGPPTLEAVGVLPLQPQIRTVKVAGVLKQESTNTFTVEDWALQFKNPGWLRLLAGQSVTVVGDPVVGSERPTLKVTDLQVSMTGLPKWVTGLEAPHWELNGYVLAGDLRSLQALDSGQPVQVQGAVHMGMSAYMKPVLNVAKAAPTGAPDRVEVAGQAPALPAPATMQNGRLMLPLRAIIEAAGGRVAWDPELWAVRVTLGSRTTTITIGSRSAGLGQLSAAPYLQDGHTMAPLDLFQQVGLTARWVQNTLNLE